MVFVMTKIFLLFLLLLIFSNSSFANELPCEYTIDTPTYAEVKNLYIIDSNELLDFKDLEFENLKIDGGAITFDIKNNNDYEIDFELFLTIGNKPRKTTADYRYIDFIGPREKKNFQKGITPCGRYLDGSTHCYLISKEFEILDNSYYYTKYETATFHNYSCKKCGDSNCSNDGQSCSSNIECGGGFCIVGICNNKNEFYGGVNPCSNNQVACNNNICIVKGSVELGFKPTCNEQECVTGFINASGICAKTPDTIKQEQEILAANTLKEQQKLLIKQQEEFNKNLQFLGILVLILVVVIIGGIILFKQKKKEEIIARTNEIMEKQKLISKEIEKRNHEIFIMKKEIEELETRKKLKESELRRLDDLKAKFDQEKLKLSNYINNEWERINIPFPCEIVGNRRVIINPYLGGYLCFYDDTKELQDYPKSSLVHRWVWKEANGRWPRPGHHIHHKDGKKYNNNPENLEEIDGDEHFNIHRNI